MIWVVGVHGEFGFSTVLMHDCRIAPGFSPVRCTDHHGSQTGSCLILVQPVIPIWIVHGAGEHPCAVGSLEKICIGPIGRDDCVWVLGAVLAHVAKIDSFFLPRLPVVGGLADFDDAVGGPCRASDHPEASIPADSEPARIILPLYPFLGLALVSALEQARRVAIDIN